MTLQHVVLFSFPAPLSAADEAQMREMVASWPAKIGLMSRCRFGNDLTGERTRGYGYLLYMEFPSFDVLRQYQGHPVHQDFLAWITARDCTALAFDYYLDSDTVLMDE
ncbi:MAG: Dabb family protein [Streptosporangiaceae bacterium]|nr:Dabb family protein [Streptosporangiaceae bacterium]MBV9857332.1 Dabb family protein [Streptosporangiaceae bacterium]